MAKPSLPAWKVAEKLDSGHHWSSPGAGLGPVVVSYSFPLTDPGYEYGGFSPFSTEQWKMAKMVLDLWADVANIVFVPAVDQAGRIVRPPAAGGVPTAPHPFAGLRALGPPGQTKTGPARPAPFEIRRVDQAFLTTTVPAWTSW